MELQQNIQLSTYNIIKNKKIFFYLIKLQSNNKDSKINSKITKFTINLNIIKLNKILNIL